VQDGAGLAVGEVSRDVALEEGEKGIAVWVLEGPPGVGWEAGADSGEAKGVEVLAGEGEAEGVGWWEVVQGDCEDDVDWELEERGRWGAAGCLADPEHPDGPSGGVGGGVQSASGGRMSAESGQ